MRCLICGTNSVEYSSPRALSAHLQLTHDIRTAEYTWRYILGREGPPGCAVEGCTEPPRYVSFRYMRHCRSHMRLSSAEAGALGGRTKRARKRVPEAVAALPTFAGGMLASIRKMVPSADVGSDGQIVIEGKPVAVMCRNLEQIEGPEGADPYSREVKGIPRQKLELARAAGIRLIQIFSDEWRDRRPIVESMLRNRLGVLKDRIGARKCSIVVLEPREGKEFLETSHIDGSARASLYLGLRDPAGDLVSVMSIRTPIQKKHGHIAEIARLAHRPGWLVPGGADRLLRRSLEWARERGFEGMLSYADLRFGEGDVYRRLGFERLADTGMAYFYTDGHDRFDRFAFRAQDGLSEREFAVSRGVRPVYTPGHAVYLLKF